jgi:hypothetical protein
VELESVLVGVVTAGSTLAAVWITDRIRIRTRWADEQRAVIGRMLQTSERAADAMSTTDSHDRVQPHIDSFYAAWGEAQLLIPKNLLRRAVDLRDEMTALHHEFTVRVAYGDYANVEEQDSFEERWPIAERNVKERRHALVAAARSHFGLEA